MASGIGVVIVAAGRGMRLAKGDKAVLKLEGEPLFYKSLKTFQSIKSIKEIVLVLRKSNFPLARKNIKGNNITLVAGGAKRTDSVFNGLGALSEGIDRVLIHDAARPFVTKQLVLNILKELKKHPAVICGLKCSDTLKLVKQGFIKKTLCREDVYFVQTPQGFKREVILKAYKRVRMRQLNLPNSQFTDEAQMVEAMGKPVKMIKGEGLNFKLTYPEDLRLAKKIARGGYSVGLGFDVHRISRRRKDLILGGIKIPSAFGLVAVSDGDVVLHALSDALCGAAGLGDIGDYFPPQDKRSKGIDSRSIVEFILKKVNKQFTIGNLDVIIITDKPRLFPYKGKITASLRKILSLPSVNVKLKSKEGLDILGGRNSISCFVFAALKKQGCS
ncbi:MAG: 2-C-methyl-D-erythritol 4-phosphate cytidylyltransferase [Candidatus Omnitrophota bacterium]